MAQAPILLLYALEQRSRANASSLPQQIEVKATWDGVAFLLGDHQCVAPLEQVKEILTHVSISRIPGAKDWVQGVANVRGNLLPILDLNAFLSGQPARMSRRNRVLVMRHKGIIAGLVVDEVLGMRHFLEEEFSEEVMDRTLPFAHMLTGEYRQRGERWGVFNIHKLADLPEFMQVAA